MFRCLIGDVKIVVTIYKGLKELAFKRGFVDSRQFTSFKSTVYLHNIGSLDVVNVLYYLLSDIGFSFLPKIFESFLSL